MTIAPHPTHLWLRAVLAASALFVPANSSAQGYPFSQRSTLTQSVALTDITLTYGRPIARGRELFGHLVPWDSIWHPGADSATRISFAHDVLIEGREVRAGDYSVWLVPRAHSAWTFILNGQARAFHKPYPGADKEVFRVDVMPESLSHMETMAIYFPVVRKDSAVMRIHWGTTSVPIRITAPFHPE